MEFDVYLFIKILKYTIIVILGTLAMFYLALFLDNLTRKGFKYTYIELIKLIGLVVFIAVLFSIKV